MQAGADKVVVSKASHKLYETLASNNKMWKTFPDYAHDSEFEADRTLLDNEIVSWISENIKDVSVSKIAR